VFSNFIEQQHTNWVKIVWWLNKIKKYPSQGILSIPGIAGYE